MLDARVHNYKIKYTMSLSDLTQEIVNLRKNSKKTFEDRETELQKMKSTVAAIAPMKESELWADIISGSKIEEDWISFVEKFDKFSRRINTFMDETGLFYLAKNRADRDYVNVGSVGVTQDGKSEFNASIANLAKGILPRGGGSQSCTTARINIINGKSPDGKSDIVRVHYYTVNEFAELMYSFLVELGAAEGDFKTVLETSTKEGLRLWMKNNKNDIRNSKKIGQNEDVGKKIALLEYFDHIDEYIDRLGLPFADYSFQELTSGKDSDRERAEKYYSSVSYFLNPDDLSEKKFFSYATKKAEVFSVFKIGNEDPVRNLQFLDTPGIGENKPGLERILAKSVSSDLDIIIAIKAARSTVQTDSVRKMLTTQLRTLLHKRPQSRKSLYFVQNLWDDALSNEGETEKMRIKNMLEEPQNLDEIKLDDSHFRTINVLKQIEYRPDGSTNSTYPIHNYLNDIFNQLIPQIINIDNEFFNDAKDEYDAIVKDFKVLMNLVMEISHKLPSDDLSKQIDKVLVCVHDELNRTWENLQNTTNIAGGIKYRLAAFCSQKTGIVLGKLLGIEKEDGIDNFDFLNEEDNRRFIDDFYGKGDNAAKLNAMVSKLAWDGGNELKCYAELKSKLLDYIKEEIFRCIDADAAQQELKETKNRIAEVFREQGKLGFVSSSDDTWWENMAAMLEKEKYPQELTSLFSMFARFTIDYREILKDSIEKVIKESRHADNFGNPDAYHFGTWDDSKKTIVHSLLCIENRVQSLVKEDVYKRELGKAVSSFEGLVVKLAELNSFSDQKEKTLLRTSWEEFYTRHAKAIFVDGDAEKKRALISTWNELCA